MNTPNHIRLPRRRERRFRFRPLPLVWRAMTYVAVALVLSPLLTQAADVAGGPQVVAGAATFRQNGNIRTVEQHTGAAVIHWQDFGIKAGDVTRFIQPGVNSTVLNRVLGANPSLLQGQLQANGSVYLINPNGIVVGPQGRIDVGAFFASTLNVSEDEFLKGGSLLFKGDSKAGLQNLGVINAKDGDVMLIAYTVKNAGEVNAAKGVAGLAAGSEVLLTHQGDQRIVVKSGVKAAGLETGVENSGVVAAAQAELKAAGGSIYELAVNQSGIVRATGVEERNGRVILTAEAGTVQVSGEMSARDADGNGGEILVGGNYQGKNATVPNAATTVVTDSARLDVSAASPTGNAGKVIVWADGATQFKGGISARGGSAGGDGGLVEVSGKRFLEFAGAVDTLAPFGRLGSLLLDPDSIVISNDPDSGNLVDAFGQHVSRSLPSVINVGTLATLLAGAEVTLMSSDYGGQTGGPNPAGFYGISLNADLSWVSGNTLTLISGDTIALNANINAANSSLILQPGSRSTTSGTAGTTTLAADKSITVSELRLKLNPATADRAPDSSDLGTINLAGTVNAATVVLERGDGGVQGDVLINNANNMLGTFRGLGATAAINGDLKVRDSSGGLTVRGELTGVAGAVEITTSGNLTLDTGAQIQNTGASDLVLGARGGSFINNADASAVDASGSGRYLIYSDAPATTTKGGLTGATVYNKTFDANAPASITATGDRFLYSLAPTLTFTATDASKTYGAANPTLNYTVSGLQSSDTLGAAISGTPAVSTTATAGTGAGTVPITVANGSLSLSDMGYGLALAPGTLTINQAPLTITADNASKTYGAANPTLAASFSGLVNGDLSSVVSGLVLGTTATTGSGVGGYPITGSGASAANYAITYAPGTLTVIAAPLTITADNAGKTYGAANPTLTASFSGLVNGDLSSVASGLSLGTTATTGSGVGAYPITGSGASAANYSISYTSGALTINQAPLTITADNQSKTYGSANPAFTASFSGLVNGDLSSVVSGLSLATTATAGSGVGAYPITGSGASAANYDITHAPGTLTVNPATLTVRADNQSRTYGDANPTLTGTLTGFVLGEDASVLAGAPAYSTAAGLTTGVGNHAITSSGGSAANYTFTRQNGTLTINPAVLAVKADNAVRVYGDANPTLTYTVSGLRNGDSASGKFNVTAFGTLGSATAPVGSYTILLQGQDVPGDNYTTFFANGTETITARPLTIRTDNVSREYGLANPAFTATFTGLAPHDSPSVIPNLGFTTLATVNSGVQPLGVTPTSGNNANYAITHLPGQLTITPAPLTIAAGSHFRDYGDANPAFTPSIASGGLRAGDTAASVNLRIETTATPASSAGIYDLTAAITSPNYTLNNTLVGSLQILPAHLDVTIGNVNRFYGEANPVNVPVSATGLKLGQTVGSVVSVLNPTSTTQPVGTYAHSVSSLSGNYQIRSVTGGGVQVTPRPITITAGSLERFYGDANPAFDIALGGMGLATHDSLAALVEKVDTTVPTTRESAPNPYLISPTLVANPNYQVTTQPGVLTVKRRPIEITMHNLARFYFDENPEITYTLGGAGLAPFHNINEVMGLQGVLPDQDANVGHHPYYPLVKDNRNYDISLTGGYLTIVPRAVEIRVDSFDIANTDPIPTFTAQFTGLPSGVTSERAFPGLTFRTSTTDIAPEVKPVPTLPVFTPPAPPAPVLADNTVVDENGVVQGGVGTFTPLRVVPTSPSAHDPDRSFSFDLGTLTVGGASVNRQFITVEGHNANPNYAVTKVVNGRLVTRTPRADTETDRAIKAAQNQPAVGISSAPPVARLSEPLTAPKYRPFLEEAANNLMKQLKESGDTEAINNLFGGGIEGFLANLGTDQLKQSLLMGAMAELVVNYSSVPEALRPPAMAEIMAMAQKRAAAERVEEAKEVVQRYEDWRNSPARAGLQTLYGDDTPDFATEVQADRLGDTVAALAAGAGAGAATGTLGFLALKGAGIALVSSAKVVAGVAGASASASGFSAGVIGAAVVAVVVVSVIRANQIAGEEGRIAAVESARRIANGQETPTFDFNNPGDRTTLATALYSTFGDAAF